MSAKTYVRRILIALGLLCAVVIASPLAIIGGVYFICSGHGGGGCGDVGLLFIAFGVMPALLAVLGFIAWTVFKRLRTLELSAGYIILTCLMLLGCFQSILLAAPASTMGHLGLEIIAAPLLTAMIIAAFCWVPEPFERGSPKPILRNAFIVISVLLLLRLARAILYPLSLLPGGLPLSFALRRLSYLGPLKLIPDTVLILAFISLFLMVLRQWRSQELRDRFPAE